MILPCVYQNDRLSMSKKYTTIALVIEQWGNFSQNNCTKPYALPPPDDWSRFANLEWAERLEHCH